MTFDEWWAAGYGPQYAQCEPVARDAWGVGGAQASAAVVSLWAPPKPVFGPRSGRWPTVRKGYLKKHGTCCACGSDDGLEVHHVRPYHRFPALELDPANLMTLCDRPGRSCHLVFGHLWDWSDWNPQAPADAARMLARLKEPKD